MENKKTISGFSKLSKRGKIKWLVENFFKDPENVMRELISYWHSNDEQQKVLDGFSENTICNFPMPLGIAPNFLIDGKTYVVPMVIEESSVVAAASSAAKFWMNRGGFKTEIVDTKKLGQVHFAWFGSDDKLQAAFPRLKKELINNTSEITSNMVKRGGGIIDIELLNLTDKQDGLYQIIASFDTCDSMGANFINSCLESFADSMRQFFAQESSFSNEERDVEVIMSILSNYTPECLVKVSVSCPIEELGDISEEISAKQFATKFHKAVEIAKIDPYRATTHNKGIFNGIDAVVLATGNDFRAVEACGHTYASRSGQYTSLSDCSLENGQFKFWIELPLALGTVGGLTSLHPIAKRSLEMLDNPNAKQLMRIIAATGLAQNFAAIKSLVTTGIQKGHMKMHLQNILNTMKASEAEATAATNFFADKTISYKAVDRFLKDYRLQSV